MLAPRQLCLPWGLSLKIQITWPKHRFETCHFFSLTKEQALAKLRCSLIILGSCVICIVHTPTVCQLQFRAPMCPLSFFVYVCLRARRRTHRVQASCSQLHSLIMKIIIIKSAMLGNAFDLFHGLFRHWRLFAAIKARKLTFRFRLIFFLMLRIKSFEMECGRKGEREREKRQARVEQYAVLMQIMANFMRSI